MDANLKYLELSEQLKQMGSSAIISRDAKATEVYNVIIATFTKCTDFSPIARDVLQNLDLALLVGFNDLTNKVEEYITKYKLGNGISQNTKKGFLKSKPLSALLDTYLARVQASAPDANEVSEVIHKECYRLPASSLERAQYLLSKQKDIHTDVLFELNQTYRAGFQVVSFFEKLPTLDYAVIAEQVKNIIEIYKTRTYEKFTDEICPEKMFEY